MVPSFLVSKVENESFPRNLGERTGQVWRDNSRRARTHKQNSGDSVRRSGTIIQSIFCDQSGASIRLILSLPIINSVTSVNLKKAGMTNRNIVIKRQYTLL